MSTFCSKSANTTRSSYRYAVDSGDGFHPGDVSYVDFRDPEGAADVSPLLPVLGGLHGATLVGAEFALGLDVQGASATLPRAGGDGGDAVTRLVDANVTPVAKHHSIPILRHGLKKKDKKP